MATTTYTMTSTAESTSASISSSPAKDALTGYMDELEKRYGRIPPLSPDNARIPLRLRHDLDFALSSMMISSPKPSMESHAQSRWSNSSPVSSAIATAVNLSSSSSSGNGSTSSHCSLHSQVDFSDRFGERSTNVMLPPSSSRHSMDCLPSPPVTSGRRVSPSSSSSSNGCGPSVLRDRMKKALDTCNMTPSSPTKSRSRSKSSSTSSSSSSSCRWDALIDDNSSSRRGHSLGSPTSAAASGDQHQHPSMMSPVKPSREPSGGLILEELQQAAVKNATAANHDNDHGDDTKDKKSQKKKKKKSVSSRTISPQTSNAKVPIRTLDSDDDYNDYNDVDDYDDDDHDDADMNPNNNSATATATPKKVFAGAGGERGSSPSMYQNAIPPRRVPEVFLKPPY